jgi:hypothetical protein
VKRQLTIRHLVAALAWLGLALAPLATPTAMAAASMEMVVVSAEAASTDMPEGMPCCPDAQKKPDCAKDCPFMAVCAGMAFLPMADAAIAVPLTLSAAIAPHDDAGLGGLAHGPPARPPKA